MAALTLESSRSTPIDRHENVRKVLKSQRLPESIRVILQQLTRFSEIDIKFWADTPKVVTNILLARNIPQEHQPLISKIFSEMPPALIVQILQSIAELPKSELQEYLRFIPFAKFTESIDKEWNEKKFDQIIKYWAEGAEQLKSIVKVDARAASKFTTVPPPRAMDSLLMAFSYFSADHEPNGPWEAMYTLQIYSALLLTPCVFALQMQNLTQDDSFTSLCRNTILGFTVFFLIYLGLNKYKRHQPVPRTALPLSNYTAEAALGRFEPLMSRNDVIKKVFLCWASSNPETRQHPLLVGDAGVGKSVIITEIARRIYFNEVPDSMKELFKDKHMFGGSAAQLMPSGSPFQNEDKMGRLHKRLQPFRNKVIVALDEVHALMAAEQEQVVGELLKSILDTSVAGFPYFLGATTKDEYRKHIAHNPARARRFSVIFVKPTDEEQTLLILREMVTRFVPDLYVSEQALVATYNATKERLSKYKQPEISKRILMNAISSLRLERADRPFKRQLGEKQTEYDNYISQIGSVIDDSKAENDILTKLAIVKEEIKKLKKDIETEDSCQEQLQIKLDLLHQNKQRLYTIASEIAHGSQSASLLKIEFYVLKSMQRQLIVKDIVSLEKRLSFSSLDKQFITTTVEESLLHEQNALKEQDSKEEL